MDEKHSRSIPELINMSFVKCFYQLSGLGFRLISSNFKVFEILQTFMSILYYFISINLATTIPTMWIILIFATAILHKEEDGNDIEYFLLFCVDECCEELIEAFPGMSVFVEGPFAVDEALCLFPKMCIWIT